VAQLRLGSKVAALSGLRFLVRGELGKPVEGAAPPPGRFTAASRAHASTLGGGRILAVGSRKRRKRESDVRALQALAGDDALAQAEALLLEAGHLGSSPQRLAAQGAFTFKAAGTALERLSQLGRAILLDRESRLYVHAGLLGRLTKKILVRLEEHAALGEVDPSIAKEELRQRSGIVSVDVFHRFFPLRSLHCYLSKSSRTATIFGARNLFRRNVSSDNTRWTIPQPCSLINLPAD